MAVALSRHLLHLVTSLTIPWKPISINLDFLQPDFCWTPSKPKPLATLFPPTPTPTPWPVRRLWGYAHRLLQYFSSRCYCRWMGVSFSNQIVPLPFGLLLKWSDGTRVEECLTMQAMRQAGLPVPKIICYGEHPNYPHAPVSILMTRMPGTVLYEELWEWFEPSEKACILSELKAYLDTMRSWQRPSARDVHKDQPICSIIGTSIRSVRVPGSRVGPCRDEQEFNKMMIDPAGSPRVRLSPTYGQDVARVATLHEKRHNIVFQHGDLNQYNILVTYDGHLSAIIDWESAAWYPDYWDFTTACMFQRPGWFWYDIMMELSEGRYVEELDGERGLRNLTCNAIGW